MNRNSFETNIETPIRNVKQHIVEDGQSSMLTIVITYKYKITPRRTYTKYKKIYTIRDKELLNDSEISQLYLTQIPVTLMDSDIFNEIYEDIQNQSRRLENSIQYFNLIHHNQIN